MPSATVIGTLTMGTDGYPTAICQGSVNVMAEGRAMSTIAHAAVPHKRYGSKRPHARVIAKGAPNVMINGKAAAYEGSLMSCGDVVGPGTPTVRIGP